MSTLYVNNIAPKDGNTINITGDFNGGGGSNILESFTVVCNGESITVPSGTYTPQNVIAAVALTDSHVSITGSSISYTPPTGTTSVIYEFNYTINWESSDAICHTAFRIDGTQITGSRQTPSLQGTYDNIRQHFMWRIPIGGTASTTTGRVASWTSAKTLDMTARRYSNSYPGNLHELLYWDGATQNPVLISLPTLRITALS